MVNLVLRDVSLEFLTPNVKAFSVEIAKILPIQVRSTIHNNDPTFMK
jgi:hypothetical protein